MKVGEGFAGSGTARGDLASLGDRRREERDCVGPAHSEGKEVGGGLVSGKSRHLRSSCRGEGATERSERERDRAGVPLS